MKKLLQLSKNGEILISEVEDANTYFTRMMGLMFRKNLPENRGLLLTPCNQIHTFSMRFPIDAVYISHDNTVIKIEKSILPRKICKTVRKSWKILELNGGIADKIGLAENDVLLFPAAQ